MKSQLHTRPLQHTETQINSVAEQIGPKQGLPLDNSASLSRQVGVDQPKACMSHYYIINVL